MIGTVAVESLAIARGDRLLVENLSLTLRAGEAVALVGRNGAGKTSLLARHRRPDPAAGRRGRAFPARPARSAGEDARSRGCIWSAITTG